MTIMTIAISAQPKVFEKKLPKCYRTKFFPEPTQKGSGTLVQTSPPGLVKTDLRTLSYGPKTSWAKFFSPPPVALKSAA